MRFSAFLDGLVLIAGPDIQWIIAAMVAGGVILALYIPILELFLWLRNKKIGGRR